MVKHVKLRRSAVLNKKPNPTVDLEYGDLGLNYNVGSPTLFARAGDDTLIEWPANGVPATTAKAGVVQLADAAAVTAGTAGRVVDAAQLKAAAPGAATTSATGVVQLADAAAVTAGTAGRVVDAAQLKAAAPADASETAKGVVELATAAETTAGTDVTRAVHPAGLKVELDKKAPLASPALTGTPTAPTAAAGTNTTQVATTAFVKAATPDATATAKGLVQLADAAAVTAGTAGRVVDAAQLKAATPDATEAVKGIVELATAAEVTTGIDTARAVTPAGLKVELDKKVAKAGDTMTGPLKLSGDPAADEEAARKKYVDDQDLAWLSSMTCQEMTWIVRNAAFSVGQPGAMPFGVGPALTPGAAFSGIDRKDYYPIHYASGSFC